MQETSHTSPFDAIRRVDERGQEYWSARELGKLLGYTTNYRNFKPAIEKAKEACKKSGYTVSDHFAHFRKMIATGKGEIGKANWPCPKRWARYSLSELRFYPTNSATRSKSLFRLTGLLMPTMGRPWKLCSRTPAEAIMVGTCSRAFWLCSMSYSSIPFILGRL